MDFAMGEFWQLMLPDLPELIEARTKQKPPENLTPDFVYSVWGGQWAFYMPMLHDAVVRDLSKAVFPREPIFTTEFGVVETNSGYSLTCLVYFVPKGHFQNGIKKIHVGGIPPVDESAVAATVDRAMATLRASKSMERDKPGLDAVIEDGDMAWCTMETRIDGKLWGAGLLKSARVIVSKDRLQPAELYAAFLGKGVGNHKVTFTLSSKFGPLEGKVVEADLIIHAVLAYVLPDWTDELAQQFGKKTYAELLQAQHDATKARAVEDWEGKVADVALMQLIEQVTFDPIPSEWIKMKAKERYDRLVSRARGNEKAVFDSLAVDDEDMALFRLYDVAKQEAWSVITLLSYGEQAGLVREEGEVMGNLSQYLRRCVRHLIDNNVVMHDD